MLGTGIYIALSRVIVGARPGALRDSAFALVNLAALYLLYFPFGHLTPLAVYLAYIGLAVAQYLLLRVGGSSIWAFFMPVAVLVAVKTAGAVIDPSAALPGNRPILPMLGALIGISYFAFRTSHLALEVRNEQVELPTVWQYLGFAFFAPTMAVGPISRYSIFRRTMDEPDKASFAPPGRAAMRLLVGAVKVRFLAGIFNQLTYSGLLLDGHPHHWIDLPVAVVAYYLFLYCNFSGFCDVAIGAAGLMGISIEENFRNPFAARNVRDFWNRWHITLSTYMRDVVFTPMSKLLIGRFGIAYANHATAATIFVVFLIIGVWHGTGWNFFWFGVMHAVGVVGTHYYTIFLKKRLGAKGFRAYNGNAWIKAGAVSVTFAYAAASLFLFANSFEDMREIFSMIVWS